MRILKMLWTLPNTLIGVLLGLLSFTWPWWDGRRALIFESDRGFRKLHARQGYAAITFGNAIVTTPDPGERLMRHELTHVRQYETWGPFYALAYGFYWVKLWLQGQDPYWDNPFEIEARAAEDQPPVAAVADSQVQRTS